MTEETQKAKKRRKTEPEKERWKLDENKILKKEQILGQVLLNQTEME